MSYVSILSHLPKAEDIGNESIICGQYLPQYFGIMYDDDPAFPSSEIEGTLRHEFKHFLQMTCTSFGINHTHRLVETGQRFIESLRNMVIPHCKANGMRIRMPIAQWLATDRAPVRSPLFNELKGAFRRTWEIGRAHV